MKPAVVLAFVLGVIFGPALTRPFAKDGPTCYQRSGTGLLEKISIIPCPETKQ